MPKPRVTAVIPCYNVSRACVDVIGRAAACAQRVIAVDDGSTDDTLAWLKTTGCQVVSLPVNQGKGLALRSGFEAALQTECDYVVTLDGDGQHRPEEIARLVETAQLDASALVVGVRDLSAMPPRSRLGNLLTRWFFRAQTGKKLQDTQTGFRLLTPAALRLLLPAIAWGRYETEMDMLFKALSRGLRVSTAPISTLYIDNNRLSSFRTLADSLRVFMVILRYAAAGVSSALLELAIFSGIILAHPERYGWGLVVARAVGIVNHYLVSRFFAFRVRRRLSWRETASYAVVAAGNLLASYGLLHLLIELLKVPAIPAMAITQASLFAATFALLQRFTFRVRLGA